MKSPFDTKQNKVAFKDNKKLPPKIIYYTIYGKTFEGKNFGGYKIKLLSLEKFCGLGQVWGILPVAVYLTKSP